MKGREYYYTPKSTMAALLTVTEEDEERQPILRHNDPPSSGNDESTEITSPSTSSNQHQPLSPSQRFVSLDVFRGLTIALMILVDDAGGAFPSINHSPWFGVTLADFVMPFFLFSVGISISLVFKKVSSKPIATKKVILRAIKLFLLGVLLQGGYFHGRGSLTYGIDVGEIRWMGVLQRISIGYLFASMSEIWLVNNVTVDSPMVFAKKYYIQWLVASLLCALYLCLLYGLYVPNWEFEAPSSYLTAFGSGTQTVNCGVTGSLEPPCNAVGLIDRFLLGPKHLYQRPVYKRTKQCSINSPDYGPLPPNSPIWCLAPFDPEGFLSSLMAAITCFLGLHFGHTLVHVNGHMQRMLLWSMTSFALVIIGYVLELLGVPFSKPLYTLSYTCLTAGASGLLLTVIFYIVDIKHFRKPTVILQWMGMNAIIIYALAACELFPAALQGLYWGSPKNNLVDATELLLQTMLHSKRWGTFTFVILEIIFWGLVAGYLDMKNIYVKL